MTNDDIFKVSWHALEPNEVLDNLDVPLETGLSEKEAAERLEEYGHNELVEKAGRTIWQKLWEQINSFVIWLLIGAAVISAILRLGGSRSHHAHRCPQRHHGRRSGISG